MSIRFDAAERHKPRRFVARCTMPGMQIENSFAVKAAPDRVYEFLLDVNNVVSCVPGAELSEVVDPNTFKGKVRIKVGPVTVSYNGTARITSRDAATRTATLEAEGQETTGSGSAQATTVMSVAADGETLDGDARHRLHRGRPGRAVRPGDHGGRLAPPGRSGRRMHPVEARGAARRLRRRPGATAAASGNRITRRAAASAPAAAPSQPAALDAVALGRAVAKERLSRLKVQAADDRDRRSAG